MGTVGQESAVSDTPPTHPVQSVPQGPKRAPAGQRPKQRPPANAVDALTQLRQGRTWVEVARQVGLPDVFGNYLAAIYRGARTPSDRVLFALGIKRRHGTETYLRMRFTEFEGRQLENGVVPGSVRRRVSAALAKHQKRGRGV